MKKLQVRVTTLEKFRRYMEGVSEYETEASLMETLTGVFIGNEYTRIGTAFHKIVECGDISIHTSDNKRMVKADESNIIYFNPEQVQTALDYKAEISGCFHEIRAYKDYHVKDQIFNISGCTDVLLGRQLRDIKTKYSYMKSITDYTDSIQSKLYMDIFEVPEFYFDVFEFQGYNKKKHGYDVSSLSIKRHEPIHCISYEGMIKDIEILLTEFLDYIRFRNLEHLFYNPVV